MISSLFSIINIESHSFLYFVYIISTPFIGSLINYSSLIFHNYTLFPNYKFLDNKTITISLLWYICVHIIKKGLNTQKDNKNKARALCIMNCTA